MHGFNVRIVRERMTDAHIFDLLCTAEFECPISRLPLPKESALALSTGFARPKAQHCPLLLPNEKRPAINVTRVLLRSGSPPSSQTKSYAI